MDKEANDHQKAELSDHEDDKGVKRTPTYDEAGFSEAKVNLQK